MISPVRSPDARLSAGQENCIFRSTQVPHGAPLMRWWLHTFLALGDDVLGVCNDAKEELDRISSGNAILLQSDTAPIVCALRSSRLGMSLLGNV
jgi:hypothetical protein